MSDYGRRLIVDLPFDQTVHEVIHALNAEGIDQVGRFDLREYLADKIHHDFRRYVVLQAATPQLAFEALQQDLSVGTILTITIAVFELADGETAVVVSEPFAPVLSDAGWREAAPRLADLADRESEQLARALRRLELAASPRVLAIP